MAVIVRTWPEIMHDGEVPIQEEVNRQHSTTTMFRSFLTDIVPGYLQTPEYARRILTEVTALPGVHVTDVEEAVAARMKRGVTADRQGKTYRALLHEPLIRARLAPDEIMRPQLDRIAEAAGYDHVEIRVLPLNRPAGLIPQNSFNIYDDTYVSVETFMCEVEHTGEYVGWYAEIFDKLWAEALSGDVVVRLIRDAASQLDGAS
ncbi:hypothetical protein GCM10027059_28990 [Myceligenerans halotolerans]